MSFPVYLYILRSVTPGNGGATSEPPAMIPLANEARLNIVMWHCSAVIRIHQGEALKLRHDNRGPRAQ
jgi:hypothetical protein